MARFVRMKQEARSTPQRPLILRLLGCAGAVAKALDMTLAVGVAENIPEATAAPAAASANSAAAWLHVDAASEMQTQTHAHADAHARTAAIILPTARRAHTYDVTRSMISARRIRSCSTDYVSQR